jgi:hypothetical protein
MTATITRNPAVAKYRQLHDQLITCGVRIPTAVYRLALDGAYEAAIGALRKLSNADFATRLGPGRFADEVAPLTAAGRAALDQRVLEHIAAETAGAGQAELDHFAYLSEGIRHTLPELGDRISDLVEDEHTRQILTRDLRVYVTVKAQLDRTGAGA